ncbi:hypothetical protein, partial [Streptomyces venezuelae]|uniref:hypothetical protein n=1 Tax=Streptomyces venezuelae TaxID=54571 RepID=UPI00278C33C4
TTVLRLLAAAVKDAGLPPGERPRLLVVARLRDLPEPLPDELRHGLGDTAVHWWWGALGRLDTATAVAPILDHGPDTSGRDRDPLAERIRRAVRSETVVEICGPDLELARLLALEWDGAQHTLGAAVGRCLAAAPGPVPGRGRGGGPAGARGGGAPRGGGGFPPPPPPPPRGRGGGGPSR